MEGCRDWQTCRCSKLGNQISPFIVNKVQLETNGFIVYRHCTGRAKWSRSRITCIYYPSVVLNARSMSIVFTCLSIIFYLPLSFIMMMILLLALCLRPVYFFSIRNCVRTAFYLQIRNDDKRVLLRRNKRHLYCKYVAAGFFDPSVLLVAIYLSDWLLTDVVSHHQAASASYTVHIIV
jgi:hypothetical protein